MTLPHAPQAIRRLRLRFDSRHEAVREALLAVRARLERAMAGHSGAVPPPEDHPDPPGARHVDPDTVELVLAEVLTNVVRHACQDRPGHDIDLVLRHRTGGLLVLIRDDGVPMPGGTPPEGRAQAPDDLPEGGFGWGLIRMLTRDIRYRHRHGRNRIGFVIPFE